MLQAATEFKKSGFSDEDAAQLGQIASMYQNISDETVTAGESASFIIAQMVAFGIEAENSMHIIDAVNETANRFAVSSGQLAGSLGIVSSTASAMGNSFESTIGMMTAITEQTRNSSKAARGLNTIFNNLAQVLDESSSNGKKIAAIFDDLGVSMYDMDGQLLSSYELLTNLNEEWDGLDTNTKNYIASTIAGTNQLNNFLALMNNFDHAIEATETALNSAGSAARENSRYMEGLEAKTQAVKASFQELANTVVNSGLVKGILDLANGFLQLLNSPIGAFVTQITLLTGVLWGGTGLIKAMKLIPNLFASAATTISGFTGVLSLTAPQLMLIAAGIAAIMAVAPAISNWFKEFTGDVEYLNGKIEESNNKLTENRDRLKDLLSIPPSSRSSEIEDEITYLQMENEELEKNIRLYKEKVNQSSLKDIRQDRFSEGDFTGLYQLEWIESGETLAVQSVQSAEEAIAKLKEWGYEYEGLGDSLDDFGIKLKEVNETVLLTSDEYLTKLVEDTKDTVSSFDEIVNASEDEKQSFIDTYNQIQAYADTLSYARDNGETLSEAERELVSYAEELKEGYSDLLNQMYPAEDSLQRLAEGAALNANEFSNLVAVYPDLADALEESDGLYKINQESLYNLAARGNETARALIKAQIEATEQTITSTEDRIKAYMAELEALQQLSGQKIFGAWGPLTPAGASANIMNMLMGEDGKLRTEILSDSIEQEKDNLLEAKNNLAELLAEVESWDAEVTGINPETGGGSSSSSSATDPIKDQSDAFKEQNEILEHNIFLKEKQGTSQSELIQLYKDYQNKLHEQAEWFRDQGLDDNSEYIRELQEQWWSLEDEIDSIYDEIAQDAEEAAEEAKKAWEEAMEAQIESLEKKQDAYKTLFSLVSDMAQDEIDALEEQRTSVEEYWQGKIDALEQANEELEEQIEKEEALDALARARQGKVMVYKDGRFQYVQDIDKVSEAQANLDRIEREEKLNSEIEQLEKSRDEALEILDEKIEDWEAFVDGWESILDDYEREQDLALLQEQLNLSEQELITKMENENWETRLENLASYVQQYKDLMVQLTGLQFDLESDNIQTGQGGTTGITPGVGSLAGTQYNAWAWVPGSGYVPVTVEGGKTQQTNLPVGTIIYGDDKSWIITGGTGGESGYTSEEYGPTPDNIWTPGKEPSGSVGGSSSGGGSSGGGNSSSVGNYTGSSTTGGPAYNIGSSAGKDFIDNAKPGQTITGGDGSSWTKNPDGSTTINRGDDTWVVPANANGTLSSVGGLSLVGENGPELRILNEGDGIIPSEKTKNLWAWGAISPASMINNIVGDLQSMGQQIGITIQNFNPNLPNIQDGQDFANYMRNNFWREAIQFAKA